MAIHSALKATVSPQQDFMKLLKARVAAVVPLEEQRADKKTYAKAVVLLAWFSLSYAGLYFFSDTFVRLALCVSLGLANASIGFNIFHDAIHGSFSYNRAVNRFWSFVSCSLLGASHFVWKYKHNYLHHQFPNIHDRDDDLETRGSLRLSPEQAWLPKYRYQHLYAPVIYAFTTLEWILARDFIRYFSGKMNEEQKLPRMNALDHLEFWASKLIYLTIAVAIPLWHFSLPAFLVGSLIVHAVMSLALASIFQLAHVSEQCKFPVSCKITGKTDLCWAELQFATTVNFAPNNRLLSWYCGGLNFQVEHHLLPGVCHSHYKKLAPVVEAMAKEFGFAYNSIPTHRLAIKGHYDSLKLFSKRESIPPLREVEALA